MSNKLFTLLYMYKFNGYFVCLWNSESADSLTAQLNTLLPEHVCPVSVTHCQQLKPVIILTFILTDGQDSLTAYLWERHAVSRLVLSENDCQLDKMIMIKVIK